MSLSSTSLGWEFDAACRNPERTQRAVLNELLARHASTEFGRAHGLSPRMRLADFVSAVPIRPYRGLQPWIDRAVRGMPRVLTIDEPHWFARSSGTTGTPKYLPITKQGLRAYQAVRDLWWQRTIEQEPAAMCGTMLMLSSPADEERLPGQSTALRQSVMTWIPAQAIPTQAVAVPNAADALLPEKERGRRVLACSLQHDVSMIVATSPSTVWVLLEDLVGEGYASARQAWPKLALLACWTEGPSALYADQLASLSGGVPIRDIGLPASEGYFAIPIARSAPAVLAAGHYVIELVAADEARGQPVPWADVSLGGQYRLVVTTPSGLWRYDTEDVVEIVGRYEQTPCVAFRRRAGAVVSIAGEKVTEQQVVAAVRTGASQHGIVVRDFVCRLVWPHDGAPRYRFEIAETQAGPRCVGLQDAVEQALCALNGEYQSRRAGGRLEAAEVIFVAREPRAQSKPVHLALELPVRGTRARACTREP